MKAKLSVSQSAQLDWCSNMLPALGYMICFSVHSWSPGKVWVGLFSLRPKSGLVEAKFQRRASVNQRARVAFCKFPNIILYHTSYKTLKEHLYINTVLYHKHYIQYWFDLSQLWCQISPRSAWVADQEDGWPVLPGSALWAGLQLLSHCQERLSVRPGHAVCCRSPGENTHTLICTFLSVLIRTMC